MLVPHDWIKRYRAAITRNGTLPLAQQPIQVDVVTLQELIRVVRPDIERDYDWHRQWGVVPEGPEFDGLIEQAVADIRACRSPGEPETYPERYINRVPEKEKPKQDMVENEERDHTPTEEAYERAQARRLARKKQRRQQGWK